MSNKWLYDVEVFSNCFLCSIKNYKTKEIITWEISDRKNEYESFKKWFSSYKEFLISFNGIEYDDSMVLYALKNSPKNGDISEFNKKLKEWSDYNIKTDFWWKDYPQYKYHNQWIDIDLFCYWSRNLRLSKKISLKSLAIQLNWGHIQELPYPHDKILTSEEIDELIKYNVNNDLGILEKLTEVFEGKTNTPLGNLGTIQLRQTAKNKYGIDCFSWDAPKIATEVISLKYCEKTKTDLKEFKKRRFEKESFQFKDLFKNIKFEFTTKVFQDLYEKWMNSYNTFSEEIIVNTKDKKHYLKVSLGVGGIHSVTDNSIYEKNDDYLLFDTDIALNWCN